MDRPRPTVRPLASTVERMNRRTIRVLSISGALAADRRDRRRRPGFRQRAGVGLGVIVVVLAEQHAGHDAGWRLGRKLVAGVGDCDGELGRRRRSADAGVLRRRRRRDRHPRFGRAARLRIVTFAPHPGWFTVRLEQPSATQLGRAVGIGLRAGALLRPARQRRRDHAVGCRLRSRRERSEHRARRAAPGRTTARRATRRPVVVTTDAAAATTPGDTAAAPVVAAATTTAVRGGG